MELIPITVISILILPCFTQVVVLVVVPPGMVITMVYFIVGIFCARLKILPLDVGVVAVVVAFEVVDVGVADACVVFGVVCVGELGLVPLQEAGIKLSPTKQIISGCKKIFLIWQTSFKAALYTKTNMLCFDWHLSF